MDNEQTPSPEQNERVGPANENRAPQSAAPTPDPNDEIPVPIAMYPSEVDERAQVVEALREEANTNRADDLGLTP